MRLVEIRRYPVKSLRGHSLGAGLVERIGLAGDRRWMIVDATGRFLTQRQYPKLAQIDATLAPNGVALDHADHGALSVDFPGDDAPVESVVIWRDTVRARVATAASDYLSTFLDRPVRLVHLHDEAARPVNPDFGRAEDRVSFADGFPLLIASTGSLDDLNWRLDRPIRMDRFRPSLVVEGAPAWAEDTWRRVRIGALTFRIVKPCARCAIPTLDPLTGEALEGNQPLRALSAFHRAANGGIIFGQNAIPDDHGALRVGDAVEIVEIGPSNLL
ncbi:MAG TPA: MOSC domain-containing protein [Roseiarcus sp.]|nr:MOSC domain-containing protein [Roseiarcus sp.]